MTERDIEFITVYLAARDVPCVSCGYNLRGLRFSPTAGKAIECRCPECGKKLTPKHIVLEDESLRLQAPKRMIQVGLAIGIAVASMSLLNYLHRWHDEWRIIGEPTDARCLASLIVSFAWIPLAYGWVRFKHRIQSIHGDAGERAMWACAAAVWLAPIASLAVYYMPG